MIKRSECKCLCHTDANILGSIDVPMHLVPCCFSDHHFMETMRRNQEKYRKILIDWEAYLQSRSHWSPLMLEVIEDQRAITLQLLLAAQLEEFDCSDQGYLERLENGPKMPWEIM